MTTELKTRIVKAPTIQIGDVIDGRTVKHVTGRKSRTISNETAGQMGSGERFKHLKPVCTFTVHVVCVGFEDGGGVEALLAHRNRRGR